MHVAFMFFFVFPKKKMEPMQKPIQLQIMDMITRNEKETCLLAGYTIIKEIKISRSV